MDRRRLFLYLLLNIFVSACVTGAILFWYDRNYRAVTLPAVQAPLPSIGQSSAPAATLSPQNDIPVEIVSVVGAGTLSAEWVVIHNSGKDQLNLTGWQLKETNRNTFTFPNLTLNGNAAVQVHSASGTDTVIDLYWSMDEAVWQSGEEAKLFDTQGNLRASYKVP